MRVIISLSATFFTFLAIDSVWLTLMSGRFYRPRIGHLMASSPQLAYAGLFYAIFAVALAFLVVLPSVEQGYSTLKTVLLGGLLGLAAYAAYDLTNQATLKDWPLSVTIVDILWGSVLSIVVSVVAVYVNKLFA